MCTAIYYKNRYFGRNLDYERSFGEEVVTMSKGFSYPMGGRNMETKYAVIGMAHMEDDIPLFYDGMNEKGLAMAGLLFEENAVYQKPASGKDNIPSWAFIPWILGRCKNMSEAEELLENLNLTDLPFSEDLPPSPLHWMIADRERCIVVEAMADGLHVYENPVGVLTNNPPFPFHLQNLHQYLNLTAEEPKDRFSASLSLRPFSRGMGAIGLPGDWSSPSRFVRAAFVLSNSVSEEEEHIIQFFHILGAVEQVQGCVRLKSGYEKTIYSCCCDLEMGVYHWKTYGDYRIWKVELAGEMLYKNGLHRLQIFKVI